MFFLERGSHEDLGCGTVVDQDVRHRCAGVMGCKAAIKPSCKWFGLRERGASVEDVSVRAETRGGEMKRHG